MSSYGHRPRFTASPRSRTGRRTWQATSPRPEAGPRDSPDRGDRIRGEKVARRVDGPRSIRDSSGRSTASDSPAEWPAHARSASPFAEPAVADPWVRYRVRRRRTATLEGGLFTTTLVVFLHPAAKPTPRGQVRNPYSPTCGWSRPEPLPSAAAPPAGECLGR